MFQGGRQNVSITSPTRALAQVYQNTSGRPLLVCASARCQTLLTTDAAEIFGWYGLYATPMSQAGIKAGIVATEDFSVTFVVPNGFSYGVGTSLSGSGSATLLLWWEILLIGSTGSI